MPDDNDLPQATVERTTSRPDLGGLAHPDPRRGGGHRHRRAAVPQRGADDHHRAHARAGGRGGQDGHQVQGRAHRPGDGGEADPRLRQGGNHRQDDQECVRVDGRGREVLGRRAAGHAERGLRSRHAALGQLHRLRGGQVDQNPAHASWDSPSHRSSPAARARPSRSRPPSSARWASAPLSTIAASKRGRSWPTICRRTARRSTSRSSSTCRTTGTSIRAPASGMPAASMSRWAPPASRCGPSPWSP